MDDKKIREDEIEITPEMIEAGVEAVLSQIGGISDAYNPYELATSVFRAMTSAATAAYPDTRGEKTA